MDCRKFLCDSFIRGRFFRMIFAVVLCATLFSVIETGAPQSLPQIHPRTVSDSETRDYVQVAIALGLPSEEQDILAFLALNKSYIVVPAIKQRIGKLMKEQRASGELFHKLADILAYAGNEDALQALSELGNNSPSIYGEVVERVFDYSSSRQNPFDLVYRALAFNSPLLDRSAASWVTKRISYKGAIEQWHAAMAHREGAVSEQTLAVDPLLRLLSADSSVRAREGLLEEAKARSADAKSK